MAPASLKRSPTWTEVFWISLWAPCMLHAKGYSCPSQIISRYSQWSSFTLDPQQKEAQYIVTEQDEIVVVFQKLNSVAHFTVSMHYFFLQPVFSIFDTWAGLKLMDWSSLCFSWRKHLWPALKLCPDSASSQVHIKSTIKLVGFRMTFTPGSRFELLSILSF